MGWERPWGYLEIAGAKFSPVLYVMMNSGIDLSRLNFFLYYTFFYCFPCPAVQPNIVFFLSLFRDL